MAPGYSTRSWRGIFAILSAPPTAVNGKSYGLTPFNGKQKADNNAKCGNRYLSWAFVEAANFARRYDEQCRRWYDRKAAKTSKVIATKALGCKLAKAAWHVMAGPCDYDQKRMFPERASKTMNQR